MGKVEIFKKLNKRGLWFICSEHPASELKQFVYDFAVESGLPIVVYSDIPKKEIQNAVIDRIRTKCIEKAENENERNWLEREMAEYDNHGFFWYSEELNDYIPNGSFWNNYVFFDEFKILSFTNCFSNLYLIDNLSELLSNVDRNDLPQALLSIEIEAIEHNKIIIVFVSPNDTLLTIVGYNSDKPLTYDIIDD